MSTIEEQRKRVRSMIASTSSGGSGQTLVEGLVGGGISSRTGSIINRLLGRTGSNIASRASNKSTYPAPPFRGSTTRLSSDPRARAVGAARRKELAAKSIKRRGMPISGPKTKGEQQVDDLFGVPNAPLGYSRGR
jgi:hypothetical protein